MTIEILPVEGLPEVRPGDELATLLATPLAELGLRDGDVVLVTQKIVSKAEGRVVREDGEGRAAWVERETRRVVARRAELVIAETEHGFVCANAGVDASNVGAGFLTLLPRDPDASAERLRSALAGMLGVDVAVVVTDTFGRAWRRGLVNVAIGCAGIPSLVDLRGTTDHTGRELEATVTALADEVAAAGGLAMGKASRIPAAIVRGVELSGPALPARELVRPPEEDLFRESPLLAVSSPQAVRSFTEEDVPREVIEEAVRAAFAGPSPRESRPWSFTALLSAAARRRLVAAIGDSAPDRGAPLGSAPALVVPWLRFDRIPTSEDAHAEQELVLLSAGAAIQNLLLALRAQGYGSRWTPETLFRQTETRAALGMAEGWFALGTVAVGRMPAGAAPPRPPLDLSEILRAL